MTFHLANAKYIKEYKGEISHIKSNHNELLGDIADIKKTLENVDHGYHDNANEILKDQVKINSEEKEMDQLNTSMVELNKNEHEHHTAPGPGPAHEKFTC